MFFLFKIQIVHKFSVLFLYRSPLQHQQNGHLQPSQKWHAKVNSLYTRKFKLNLINIYCCLKIGENRRNTANNRNFRKFSCLGLLYPRFTTIKATIWHEIVNLCCIVPYQILPWWCRPITVIYICRPARLKTAKNRDFDRILYFWGSPFIWIGLLCRPWGAKNTNFTVFQTSSFCGGATYQCRDKVERGCTNYKYPLSKDIKLSEFERLNGKRSQAIPFKSATDKYTKNTKDIDFLSTSAACEVEAPSNLEW